MNVRSDQDGSVHRPTFSDARVALCERRLTEYETWWTTDHELTCDECRAKSEETP